MELTFNGVNAATGDWLTPGLTVSEISSIAAGVKLDRRHAQELESRQRRGEDAHLGVEAGVDPQCLDQAGWAVIFAQSDEARAEELTKALSPLLALRREQAGALYQEFSGPRAYAPGETKSRFLARHGMGPGPAKPKKVPYYLLLVGDPEAIPFSFQYQLGVDYAVGRLDFDHIEEFERYATSVAAQEETGSPRRDASTLFFGMRNQGDQATQLSADELVAPLASFLAEDQPDWEVVTRLGEDAHKQDLIEALRGDQRHAVLFTASHGVGFPNGDPRQLPHQGALLCQDWPGMMLWGGKEIPPEHYFSADDIEKEELDVAGLIAFHFACYGAGTPRQDDFAHLDSAEPDEIAPQPFVARLPRKLLSHASGGALAVIGHVERAWGWSFLWPGAGSQRVAFESTLKCLLEGHRVGSAMEYFSQRYASIATELNPLLRELNLQVKVDELEIAGLWTANNDARSYTIVGDPAVRLAVDL